MKSNQHGHVSLANASKLSKSHSNYLSAINFSRFDVVVEAINKWLFAIISARDLPTHYRQVTDRLLTDGRLLADSWPTVGRKLVDRRPTVGRQSADRRPTISFGNCSSLLPLCCHLTWWMWQVGDIIMSVSFDLQNYFSFLISDYPKKVIVTVSLWVQVSG